jgi:putative transposase
VKALKGRSSRKIQQEFPELAKRYWGRHFWGIGYTALTTGEVTDQTIQAYIANHASDDDQAFTVDN